MNRILIRATRYKDRKKMKRKKKQSRVRSFFSLQIRIDASNSQWRFLIPSFDEWRTRREFCKIPAVDLRAELSLPETESTNKSSRESSMSSRHNAGETAIRTNHDNLRWEITLLGKYHPVYIFYSRESGLKRDTWKIGKTAREKSETTLRTNILKDLLSIN